MDQEQESPKVKVSDRRRFSAEGDPLEETGADPVRQAAEESSTADEASEPEPAPPESPKADTAAGESSATASPAPESAEAETTPEFEQAETLTESAEAETIAESAEAGTTPSEGQGMPPLPPASFETLVLSFGMQAQFELGCGGQADQQPPNLDLARHSIDMLSVLQEKTKGNLSMEESRLLENTLTELRFRYVQVVGEINKQAKA